MTEKQLGGILSELLRLDPAVPDSSDLSADEQVNMSAMRAVSVPAHRCGWVSGSYSWRVSPRESVSPAGAMLPTINLAVQCLCREQRNVASLLVSADESSPTDRVASLILYFVQLLGMHKLRTQIYLACPS
jgi:hypothetical protein